ncbi:uncharacterized protein A1O9_12566 [Exophiala aquamarina CBS 119918]|uniref:Protein BIG1 n=1 Tax=Exophiala aquamarina CBS 119918 TaxID=1182545 RepID=A0A072NVJ7_9EURO|nr:uncharacterized protein A1O9_12566 [Exophiala aquamarina CBS 119918]KEF51417.1 hypothetical protein A1O9_12566 [Exophiala aquamarina CBS 119918]
MRFFGPCALALAVEGAYGYLDAQPFFMFSTSELLISSSRLQNAQAITSDVALTLSQCPSDYYILVSQQGVSARDYQCKKNTPALAQRLSTSQQPGSVIKSSLAVTDVVGTVDPTTWTELLQTTCGVQTTEIHAADGEIPTSLTPAPRLIHLRLPAPSSESRAQGLASNDAFFATLLEMLPTQKYTVLYTTRRAREGWFNAQVLEPLDYEMDSDIQEALHSDLKRNLGTRVASGNKTENQTMIDGPLFDKYQFFTPGIFMGFLTGFLLLSILYVAVSAVASLQVTYAAFDKETGALAGKKAQ